MRWLACGAVPGSRASSPLSNLRSSWMASTHWNSVRGHWRVLRTVFSELFAQGAFWKPCPEAEYVLPGIPVRSADSGRVADAL